MTFRLLSKPYNDFGSPKIIGGPDPRSILWTVTHACRLRCVYCDYPRKTVAQEPPDLKRAEETIIAAAPDVLSVSGGEPTLVAELPKSLRNIRRALPGSLININSSLSGDREAEALRRMMPLLNGVMISLDDVGNENLKTRGIAGEEILSRLIKLRSCLDRTGISLTINAVVTIHNYNRVQFWANKIWEQFPRAGLVLSAVLPGDGPLAITKKEKRIFCGQIKTVSRSAAAGQVLVNGFHGPSKTCLGQELQGFVNPSGQLTFCRQQRFTERHTRDFFRRYLLFRGFRDARHLLHHWAAGIGLGSSYLCFSPCNTADFLSTFLTSLGGRIDLKAPEFALRGAFYALTEIGRYFRPWFFSSAANGIPLQCNNWQNRLFVAGMHDPPDLSALKITPSSNPLRLSWTFNRLAGNAFLIREKNRLRVRSLESLT